MITLIFGVPGSGKTYFAVDLIKKRYLIDDELFFRVKDDVTLITNIKLNLSDTKNYVYIEEMEKFVELMNVDLYKQLKSNQKFVFVIDECQLLFAKEKKNDDLFFFLQYHRHFSIDIILITQTPSSLPKKVVELCEFVVEAVPKSVSISSRFAFRYRVLHPFDFNIVLKRLHLAFSAQTFYLYSDMFVSDIFESESKKLSNNAFFLPVASFLFFFVVFMLGLKLFLSSVSPSSESDKAVTRDKAKAIETNHHQKIPTKIDNVDEEYKKLITIK